MDWAGTYCEKEGTHKTNIAVVAFLPPPPPPFLEAWEGGRGERSRKYALEETVCVMEVEVEEVGVAG